MKVIKRPLLYSVLTVGMLSSASASAAIFTSGNNGNFGFAGNDSFPGYGAAWSTGLQGQAFQASGNPSPDLAPLSTVFLQDVTFFLRWQ